MKIYFAALVLFLVAFAGLAAGLILKRKGLRGGCGSASVDNRDCQCKSVTDAKTKSRSALHSQEGED